MDEEDKVHAAQALAAVQEHQDRARQAARLPWWVYPAIFVVSAGGGAANDFLSLGGAKLMAIIVLLVLVIVFVAGLANGSAPLSRVRGVQPRQSFEPRVFGALVIIGGVGAWLVSSYGAGITHTVATAVGLQQYPDTVAGVLYGIAFTALFALSQLLRTNAQRRTNP